MRIESKNGKKHTRIDYYTPDGKRHQKRFTGATAAEVRKKALEFLELNKTGEDTTLLAACNQYINARSEILSPSTIVGYKKTVRNEFQPLMHRKCNTITDIDLQYCVNDMASRVSLKTIKNHYSFIHSVLTGVTHKTYAVDFPQKKREDIYIPTDEDVNQLIDLADGEMKIIIMMAAYLGMRRGEIAALTNDDLKNGQVRINKALVYDGSQEVLKAPKTYSSYRVLDMPLKLKELVEPKLANGEPIITLSLSSITHRYQRLIARMDCPHFSMHKLRHYFSSKLLAAGISDQYAIKLTGHSSTRMLQNTYQHILENKEKEVREIAVSLFDK